MSKKFVCASIFIVTLVILVLFYVIYSNQLIKSEENIRAHMLTIVPIGTSMNETLNIIQNTESWEVTWISYEHGYGITKSDIPSDSYGNDMTVIGHAAIRVRLGEYGIILKTGVAAYFGFDENHNLIDVHIRKDVNSI